jgi:hypothetical protein
MTDVESHFLRFGGKIVGIAVQCQFSNSLKRELILRQIFVASKMSEGTLSASSSGTSCHASWNSGLALFCKPSVCHPIHAHICSVIPHHEKPFGHCRQIIGYFEFMFRHSRARVAQSSTAVTRLD